jgi:hypothetical protein
MHVPLSQVATVTRQPTPCSPVTESHTHMQSSLPTRFPSFVRRLSHSLSSRKVVRLRFRFPLEEPTQLLPTSRLRSMWSFPFFLIFSLFAFSLAALGPVGGASVSRPSSFLKDHPETTQSKAHYCYERIASQHIPPPFLPPSSTPPKCKFFLGIGDRDTALFFFFFFFFFLWLPGVLFRNRGTS